MNICMCIDTRMKIHYILLMSAFRAKSEVTRTTLNWNFTCNFGYTHTMYPIKYACPSCVIHWSFVIYQFIVQSCYVWLQTVLCCFIGNHGSYGYLNANKVNWNNIINLEQCQNAFEYVLWWFHLLYCTPQILNDCLLVVWVMPFIVLFIQAQLSQWEVWCIVCPCCKPSIWTHVYLQHSSVWSNSLLEDKIVRIPAYICKGNTWTDKTVSMYWNTSCTSIAKMYNMQSVCMYVKFNVCVIIKDVTFSDEL